MQNGKLVFVGGAFQMTSDHLESVAQRLYIRLKSTKFKWFWNEQYGIDWFGKIFGKAKNKTRIDMILKNAIREEQWVESITSFSSTVNSQTRVYSCQFKAKIRELDRVSQFFVITTQNGFILTTESNKSITTTL